MWIRASTVAFFLLAAVACDSGAPPHSQAASPPALARIHLATFSKSLGNAPYYVARELGFFEADTALAGIAMEYGEYNDRPTIASAFASKELGVLFSADAPAYLIRAQGEDVRIVGVSATTAQEIIVPAESALRRAADLRGHSVVVLAGTSSHYALRKVLSDEGLDPPAVEIGFMEPAQAKVAFETGRLEAWAVWPPWVEQQQVTGRGRVLEGSEALIHSVMTVPVWLIQDYGPVVGGMVRAIAKAKEWMVTHPVDAQAVAAKYLELDSAVVATAWPKFDWTTALTPEVIGGIEAKARFLDAEGMAREGANVEMEDFVSTRFVPIAAPSAKP